ncbi:hypothetical protein ACT7C7_29975 [Bacillus cereus]
MKGTILSVQQEDISREIMNDYLLNKWDSVLQAIDGEAVIHVFFPFRTVTVGD